MPGTPLGELLETERFQASEDGVWATVDEVNPATGEVEEKHARLVSHDGMTFGSGWFHESAGG